VLLSCPFNLMLCSPERTRQRFLEELASPWLERVRCLSEEQGRWGAQNLQRYIAECRRANAQPASSRHDAEESPTDAAERLTGVLKNRLMVWSPLPSRIEQALPQSYDGAVLTLGGGLDPVDELWVAGRQQTTRLCALLAASWEGFDLPYSAAVSKPGVVHLFWRTHESAARRLVLDPQSPWHAAGPPVLLMRQRASSRFVPSLPESSFATWGNLLVTLDQQRRRFTHATEADLSPEAAAAWGAFHTELLHDPAVFAPWPRQFFDWLPELMLRLAALLGVLHALATPGDPGLYLVKPERVQEACAIVRWLAHEHLACLEQLREGGAAEGGGQLSSPAGCPPP
jgi:hypothetical protein